MPHILADEEGRPLPLPYRVIFFDLGDTLIRGGGRREWVPGARETLARLRAGADASKLGILSNTANLKREQIVSNLLPPDFDLSWFEPSLVLLSSEVRVEKPSPAIFRLALERAGKLGAAPTACLYCTEDLLETLAAQQAGMHAARLLLPPPTGDDLPAVLPRLPR